MPAPRTDAREVIWAVAAELQRRHGIARVYGRATPALGVLSICAGLTVWTDGTALRWHDGEATITWRAADTQGAAARLAAMATRTSWNPPEPARKTAPGSPRADAPDSGPAGRIQGEWPPR